MAIKKELINQKTLLLCILDGIGLNPNTTANSVALANTCTLDYLFKEYPNTTLTTFGVRVGLPEGQMGNSEVGHLNIGAGRVVKQWLLKISEAFEKETVLSLPVFNLFLKKRGQKSRLHLIGLTSFGGVHSDTAHLLALLKLMKKHAPEIIPVVHLISDGRDCGQRQFLQDLEIIENFCQKEQINIEIGSLMGRFYAMDRDQRWQRTQKAYDALTSKLDELASFQKEVRTSPFQAVKKLVENSYNSGITDEFLEPIALCSAPMTNEDLLLFWNFRSDRLRQLVAAFSTTEFTEFDRNLAPFNKEQILCFTEYDKSLGLPFLFQTEEIKNHLGDVISKNRLTQLRIAETEKYPHVTYFFNGGTEIPAAGEDRILVPSPRDVKTYDLKPEMSAYQVTEKVIEAVKHNKYDLIILNFANGDMVGHTGVLDAAIKAVEVVDKCLGKILDEIKAHGGEALIIADHGNAEQMINYQTGEPHTAHTTHPVPAIIFSERLKSVSLSNDAALCDVAPTVLKMLDIEIPKEMTGKPIYYSAFQKCLPK